VSGKKGEEGKAQISSQQKRVKNHSAGRKEGEKMKEKIPGKRREGTSPVRAGEEGKKTGFS